MKQSRGIGEELSFSKIVLFSTILHLLFISLVVIPLQTRERAFGSYYVTLVGPIQTPSVSEALLPKEREVTAQETIKVPPKADISLESIGRVEKEIERIRLISALSKRKRDREGNREIQIGGEKPSQGTGISIRGSSEGIDFYYSIIRQRIQQYWVVPDLKTSGLEIAKISIRIGDDGKIISQEIEKSSGDLLFDRSAMKAISKASPLPPPPQGEIEIGLNFHP